MDTDSMYMAVSDQTFDNLVKPELKKQYLKEKHDFLARTDPPFTDKKPDRTPGLFKLEHSGKRMIALTSNCYYSDGDGDDKKISSKGVNKSQNTLDWDTYYRVLQACVKAGKKGTKLKEREIDKATTCYFCLCSFNNKTSSCLGVLSW